MYGCVINTNGELREIVGKITGIFWWNDEDPDFKINGVDNCKYARDTLW